MIRSSNSVAAARCLGAVAALGLAFGVATGSAAAQESPVRFGTPPWPGATVKTEVATQLLKAMGYETETKELGTEAVILNGLASDELDVYMALWYPLSAGQLDPLVEEGKVVRLSKNLEGTVLGLAVPQYVREAGIKSVDALADHAERFDRKIYGIEAGNYWNKQAKAAIKANKYGLGDWELVPSSTSAMLTQVGRAVKNDEWILFYGWRPHWMNVPYDLHYLPAPDDSNIADVESTIYNIVRAGFPERRRQVTRFLRQFHVELEMQDKWIFQHGKQKRPEGKVARQWIAANMDTVRNWVEDVETAKGASAWEAVQAEFGG